ncbi:hypothetical protein CI109_100750 [Kwoniella shandongensis]|uniref:Uncharacterized protein n=1 Tax=Kwoniella shandongensis TaxID=1734106 RepID=A0A5M6BMT0_9TREE|nr:uncharacterized protein CI109_007502 [Kwoniella shandongensis]KAA5524188.1 hypothetical protein CI109_007502 [Kwoniella shandongensis]
METDTFNLHDDHDDPHHHHDQHSTSQDDAAEAVLASLRAVINDPTHTHTHTANAGGGEGTGDDDDDHHNNDDTPQTLNNFTTTAHNDAVVATSSSLSTSEVVASLTNLEQLMWSNQGILNDLNSPGAIQNLAQNLTALSDGHKKQLDLVKGMIVQLKASNLTAGLATDFSNIDPDLSPFVLRSEYESLQARYDALIDAGETSGPNKRAAGGSQRKPRLGKQAAESGSGGAGHDKSRVGDSYGMSSTSEGRKKRSIKLEHLVHKMANRRLGVEYAVSNFESKGSRDLPDPASEPRTAAESPNEVDEYRPDFRGDINATSVKPFIEKVVEDVVEAWDGGVGAGEPDVDRERITNAVHIYWTRLSKRYDEQLHRERGEIHRDELSRKKQNTYRRQQSLLARRLAAFDSSPLNMCKLRALYRTLLTIDFAAQTQDQPDPKRAYTEEEWNAYRKLACGSRAGEAHEVIDQFWLSSNVRALLIMLDVYATDQNMKSRKKGRPKQPNPTFHLPSSLWDRSTLPTLRPKDAAGLPISGAHGIILFKFHVDEKVQEENPEWAKGLYDNPPIPDEDATLPSLPEVMTAHSYALLTPLIKEAREKANPRVLVKEEIEDINTRVFRPEGAIEVDQSILDPTAGLDGGQDGDYMTFAALSNLASAPDGTNGVGLGGTATPPQDGSTTNSPFILPAIPSHQHPINMTGVVETPVGPSPGSSMRARKLGKRMASEVPGGAATPVPKRKKDDSVSGIILGDEGAMDGALQGIEVEGDLGGDAAFLDAL